jgi:hypothetical protein
MNKRKPLTQSEMAAELAKLDLIPDDEASKRSDDLMRSLLATPPDPYTPKRKPESNNKPAK